MLERQIETAACRKILAVFGIRSVKLELKRDTGYPDRLFWVPGGKPLMIEFKRPGEKPTPKQEYIHEMLRQLGYMVVVCCSVVEATRAVAIMIQREEQWQQFKKESDYLTGPQPKVFLGLHESTRKRR